MLMLIIWTDLFTVMQTKCIEKKTRSSTDNFIIAWKLLCLFDAGSNSLHEIDKPQQFLNFDLSFSVLIDQAKIDVMEIVWSEILRHKTN